MKRLVTVLGLSMAVLVGGLAFATDPSSPTLARIVENKEVRIGMSGNQPPFTVKDAKGNLIGFEVDIAKGLAHAMGAKLTLVEKPFAELLPALANGEVDMVMSGVTMTPERSLTFAFAGPYYVSGKSVLTKSKELAAANEASDFNQDGLKLVALEGSTSAAFVQNVIPKATLVTAPDYKSAVKMLSAGKVDAMIGDLPALVVAMIRGRDLGLTTAGALLTMEPIGVALPAGDPQLVTFISSLLTAMDTTGKIDERAQYWFEGAAWLQLLP